MDYKEKLRLAKEALKSGSYDKKTIEYIFPELAESEDERIRKELLDAFKASEDSIYIILTPRKRESFIAWLEKQGEQKHNPVLDIEIPFGAKNSELQEVSYHIPEGFHAEIASNRVVIKRGEQKPTEWSGEDYNFIKELCNLLASISKDGYVGKYYTVDLVEKLKSLRPQSHWKPSDLQIEALESATENCAYSEYEDCLRELIGQLKNLKG